MHWRSEHETIAIRIKHVSFLKSFYYNKFRVKHNKNPNIVVYNIIGSFKNVIIKISNFF